jgi:hypothetical protein
VAEHQGWGAGMGLASDDLGDALVAHAHDLGDGRHRQAIGVGHADGFVALVAEVFASLIQAGFAAGVVLGEGAQAASGLGCSAFRAGDSGIV